MKWLIMFGALCAVLGGCRKAGDDLVLIPEGYRGWVLIKQDPEFGQRFVAEHGQRVWRVPASGVLFTRGIVRDEAYAFEAPDGRRTPIRSVFPQHTDYSKIDQVIITGIAGLGYDSTSDCGYRRLRGGMHLFVGHPQHDDHLATDNEHARMTQLALAEYERNHGISGNCEDFPKPTAPAGLR